MGGFLSGFGLTSLIDSQSTFFCPGLPVFYRTKNFDLASVGQAVSEMGFTVTPVSGAELSETGTTDIQIFPQPSVKLMTTKQLADAKVANTNLRVGARTFNISHSWVYAIQQAQGWANPRQVFNDPSVVGLYHDGLLFELVSFVHNDAYGQIVDWDVICNANEIQ